MKLERKRLKRLLNKQLLPAKIQKKNLSNAKIAIRPMSTGLPTCLRVTLTLSWILLPITKLTSLWTNTELPTCSDLVNNLFKT